MEEGTQEEKENIDDPEILKYPLVAKTQAALMTGFDEVHSNFAILNERMVVLEKKVDQFEADMKSTIVCRCCMFVSCLGDMHGWRKATKFELRHLTLCDGV